MPIDRLPKREAAMRVAAESIAPESTWPARGVMPWADGVSAIRRAGWPIIMRQIEIAQPESVDASGWHRPARSQATEVVTVPETWLRRLAELMGKPWPEACRGIVE